MRRRWSNGNQGKLYGFALPYEKSLSRIIQRNASACVAVGAMETKGNYMVLPSPVKKVCPELFRGIRRRWSIWKQGELYGFVVPCD